MELGPKLTLIDATYHFLGVPARGRPSARRASRLQRHADALHIAGALGARRRIVGVQPEELALLVADMLARGEEPSTVERRRQAFQHIMELADREAWTGFAWRERPFRTKETPEAFEVRRAAILAAMNPARPYGAE